MITIQSAMLVALGFLSAGLLALLAAPAFWARAVRLTTQRIRDAMPLTDSEIRADKDRIRAEYAIHVHGLESQVEQARLAAARQTIDLNRRDAVINRLEGDVEGLKARLEEVENARRVLEQTVSDRLPRVEQRLGEARKLIFSRDREIAELSQTADKQSRALAEAAAINAQQMSEMERLSASLAVGGARRKDGASDARLDGEVALRSELEALRAKTRDQSQLIARMQRQTGRFGGTTAQTDEAPASANRSLEAARNGAAGSARPRKDIDPASATGVGEGAVQLEHEREVKLLNARLEDQTGEIERLKAALAVFEGEGEGDERKLFVRDSRIGLKARVSALEAHNERQREAIARARSELAAANERLARQAAHFTSELKRLGAGTLVASGQPRPRVLEPRQTLAERVAQTRSAAQTRAASVDAGNRAGRNGATVKGNSEDREDGVGEAKPAGSKTDASRAPEAVPGGEKGETAPPAAPERRQGRLLDRISGLAKTS